MVVPCLGAGLRPSHTRGIISVGELAMAVAMDKIAAFVIVEEPAIVRHPNVDGSACRRVWEDEDGRAKPRGR